MSASNTAHVEQPATFAFTQDNLKRAEKIIAKYPPGRQQSAMLPLLDMAQRQHQNWVPRAAMDYIAGLLGIAPIRVYEVATCERKLGIGMNETTQDGLSTLKEVECLGACVNAPMVQINDDYYEDLDGDSVTKLLEQFARGESPHPGSVIGRQGAAPVGGPTTLTGSAGGE
jgi:NADH:ubiquinone oxidoreductase subunit E